MRNKDKECVSLVQRGLGKSKATPPNQVFIQKKTKEVKKGGQQPSKSPFSFVIYYNSKGKGYSMKGYTSASRVVCKKIERRGQLAEKGKNSMKIMDDNGFTKVVNTQRSLRPTLEAALKTPIPEPRIVLWVLNWDEVEATKTKAIVERAERDG